MFILDGAYADGLEIRVDTYNIFASGCDILTIVDNEAGVEVANITESSNGPLTYHTSNRATIRFISNECFFTPRDFHITVRYVVTLGNFTL